MISQKILNFVDLNGAGYLQKTAHIPAPVIFRYLKGDNRISKKTYLKLYRAINSYTYHLARESGATPHESSQIRTFDDVQSNIYTSMRKNNLDHNESYTIAKKSDTVLFDKYLTLRKSGVTKEVSEKWASHLSIKKVNDLSKKYLDIAEKLSKGNKVKKEYILEGMRKGFKRPEQWEEYISLRRKMKWIPIQYDRKQGKYTVRNTKDLRKVNIDMALLKK